jgi:hypothetical protein
VPRNVLAFFTSLMLSTVTSPSIIFLSHPAGIGDRIRVRDNDFRIEATIVEIALPFTLVQPPEGACPAFPDNRLHREDRQPAAAAGRGRERRGTTTGLGPTQANPS